MVDSRTEGSGDLLLRGMTAGVLLPITAHPGARRNAVRGIRQGRLKVAVTQVPEQGKANRAIVQLLSRELRLKKSQLEWHSGETSSQKQLLVHEISMDDLRARIEACLSS